jgi:hypothetical protein
MALIVEDGTVIEGANSYVAIADVTAYASAIGNTAWAAAAEAAQEAAILRAMRYIEGNYEHRWKGLRRNRDQALTWPRADVFDQEGYDVRADHIPQLLKDAVCEAALREIASANSLNPDLSRGDLADSVSVSAGPVSQSRSFRSDTPLYKLFPQIENKLKRYIKNEGGRMIPLLRS